MSEGTNVSIIVGRVMAKPASEQTQSGGTATTLLVGTKNRGASQTHRCILFGKVADFAADHVKVGNWVSVVGRLDYRPYFRNDVEHVSAEIYVINFQLLPSTEVPADGLTEPLRGNY